MRQVRWPWIVLTAFTAVGAPAADAGRPWVEGKPYDVSSPADRQLMAFDKAHPACRMWTDWHKLCSRTGKNGTTFCRTDPTSRVKPSTPFCAGGPDERSAAEAVSSIRYCATREKTFAKADKYRATGPYACTRYQSPRPFSGERIEQMLHPACQIWGDDYPGPAICSTDPQKDGLPSCDSRDVRAILRTEPFVCRKWKPVPGCKRLIGGLPYYQPQPGDLDVRDAHMLSTSSVSGTYCND